MLYLDGIEFAAIRSFKEKQEVDFSSIEGCCQIRGVNHDTGGSSGAAKSTVPKALDYLIGVSDIPATLLQNRDTKEPIKVTGRFRDEHGQHVVFSRSSRGGVSLRVGDKTTEGTSKEVEAEFDKLIQNIPRDVFRKMYHKRQGERGFFLSLTPKESYSFMMKAVDLEEWEDKMAAAKAVIEGKRPEVLGIRQKLDSANSRLKELEDLLSLEKEPEEPALEDVASLEKRLKELQAQHERLKNDKESELSGLEKPEKPVLDDPNKEEKDRLKDKLERIKQKISEVRESRESEVASLDERLKEIEEERALRLEATKRRLKEAKDELDTAKEAKSTLNSKVESARILAKDLEALNKSTCPTCLREWADETYEEKLRSKEAELEGIKADIKRLKGLSDSAPSLSEKVDELTSMLEYKRTDEEQRLLEKRHELTSEADPDAEKLKEAKEKIEWEIGALNEEYTKMLAEASGEYQEALTNYNNKAESVRSSYGSKLESVADKISRTREEIASVKMKRRTYEEALKNHKDKTRALSDRVKDTKKNVKAYEKELEDAEKELALATESHAAIKSFTMKVFQDTLDTISATATDMLEQVPNTQSKVITFESFKEQKNGKVKEEISATVSSGGHVAVDIRTLSGGERSSLDLAVDLAVLQVLEDRFNKGLDVFILDEPFDGLDTVSKQQYLEVLTNANTSKKLFIVDHSSEVQEMVNDTITVEKRNDVSWIS